MWSADTSRSDRGRIVIRLFVMALVGVTALAATAFVFALTARALGFAD